ncbi:hypothetical protein [Serinicoccus sediminis]|uniref:hypothetical protein n=1 Tax=Serinicoccus sediminis TaxID=2306021 RepID=UPI00102094D4|nr:hypothetical protein [Serinicoccus sediminis]
MVEPIVADLSQKTVLLTTASSAPEERRADVRHTSVGVALAVTGTMVLLAACGQAPPENPASNVPGTAEPTELIGDCAADYPTYETVEAALADTDVVIQGVSELKEVQSTAPGAPPGAHGWSIAIIDPLDSPLEDRVDVVATEDRPGTDPCGPRITPDLDALLFLATDRDTYYPVAVLTESLDGTYIDADRRIPPVDLETIRPQLEQHNADT